MAVDAEFLLFRPKRILLAKGEGWLEKGHAHCIQGRVQIAGTLPRACWFRASVFARAPETFTFQLECELPGQRSHLPLYRLDVRPFGSHLNGQYGPREWRHRLIPAGQTHEHCCLDHLVDDEMRVRAGGVQTARAMNLPRDDYASALAYVCDKLRVENGDELPVPQIQGNLF